ncbi:MAG: hypothetical protein ACP5NC_07560 [Nitrososphaeria archaeon]
MDDGTKVLKFNNTNGPVLGTIIVRIDEKNHRLICEYNVSVGSPMGGWVSKHFMSGVEHAFDRLLAESPERLTALIAYSGILHRNG